LGLAFPEWEKLRSLEGYGKTVKYERMGKDIEAENAKLIRKN